jgi:hypothetical protein
MHNLHYTDVMSSSKKEKENAQREKLEVFACIGNNGHSTNRSD